MVSDEPIAAAPPTVFLSYASEDRAAARAIGDALPAYGIEVWYDESELGGGEAWDQKIRKQIRDCDYFMALVSAQTESRHEGYFRREWRLAVERTLDMADDHLFLLPVVIDDTNEARARVPEKFLTVQWLRVPGGQPTPALEALCRRIVSGEAIAPPPPKPTSARAPRVAASARALSYPEFPRHEPGQRIKYAVEVTGWAFTSTWMLFRRVPRWIRILAIVWLGIIVLSRGCAPEPRSSDELSPAKLEKLKAISDNYKGGSDKAAVAQLTAQIARQFATEIRASGTEHSPLLAIPFAAPAGDAAAAKLADSAFAQVYGRVAISHRGRVGISDEPLPSCDVAAAVARGHATHAEHVLCGAIEGAPPTQALHISIVTTADASVMWSRVFPLAGADAAKIAAEVDAKLPAEASE